MCCPNIISETTRKTPSSFATGVIATLAALLLVLLISPAKTSLDIISNELLDNAANLIVLNRNLAGYGPETGEVRATIKHAYAQTIQQVFSEDASHNASWDTPAAAAQQEAIQK